VPVEAVYRRGRNPLLNMMSRALPNLFASVPILKLHRVRPITEGA